jgi:8-oxo-dGTP diphosphatase
VFGDPAGPEVVIRPSANGIVVDGRGRLAAARTPEGLFLPGGGIEPGETPDQAVEREALEECGLVVRLEAWERRAIQITGGAPSAIRYEKRSTFRAARPESVPAAGREPDHALEWVEVERAGRLLTDESHRWAVAEWSRERR